MSRAIPSAALPVPPATASADVRTHLVDTLRRDLVGPRPGGDADLQDETLPARPSRWYLTGFLKPRRQAEDTAASPAAAEGELGAIQGGDGGTDDGDDDPVGTRRSFLPSSIGISALLPSGTPSIEVRATWGDYAALDLATPDAGSAPGSDAEAGDDPASQREPDAAAAPPTPDAPVPAAAAPDMPGQDTPSQGTLSALRWRRTPRAVSLDVSLNTDATLATHDLPGSGGLHLAVICRPVRLTIDEAPRDLLAVQVFLVNDRPPTPVASLVDEVYAFQAGLELRCEAGFVARPDLRGAEGGDWDQQVNDLHFAGVGELAVGHNVAAEWEDADPCRRVCTAWMPQAMVPRVEPFRAIAGERRMEELGKLPDFAAARAALDPLTHDYRAWIAAQRPGLAELTPGRRAVAATLLDNAATAADRIEAGIAALADPDVLDAFRLANRAVALAAMRREAQERRRDGKPFDPAASRKPEWYPFQLAFILLGLAGLADPHHPDRECVDLLFFPTGGGKTEAYLGLAAFAIGLRRRRNPGLTGAGLAVLMRYTLRLLTLDQLGRAAAVICAMELERVADPAQWGDWPIEIGLWVGQGATPNRMGRKGEPDPKRRATRTKVLDLRAGRNTQPIPIKACPWCGSPFGKDSFSLAPDWDVPRELVIACTDPTRACDFHTSKSRPLPIQAVDEPIYRRLPAFMIATVDKFAGMPWTGEIAGFFGGADRHVPGEGFHGAANPGRGVRLPAPLKPPELVIQDELHLISGPLGTMAGLYEAALDRLCLRDRVRPKIVASTATVRRAEKQIRALFDRGRVDVFPPPGPDRGDSFFARSRPKGDPSGRLYVGIAAPGGSPKVNFLRGAVTLMAAAEHQWTWHKGASPNSADPYMTLLCYFNALRELGSARNMVEGEIQSRLAKYGGHKRVGETDAGLRSRQIDFDCPELTSRVSTDRVSETKERLTFPHERKGRVDAALATNMISVGLDITRLGLMLVSGQPKTVSEYIQATSRIGRSDDRPGLVVVLLNTNKPRDRSHYERFRAWHDAFYRGVEAVSVTPFSARALDRGLAPVVVALARLGDPILTGDPAAGLLSGQRAAANTLAGSVAARAGRSDRGLTATEAGALAASVGARVTGLLDAWEGAAARVQGAAASLVYAGQGVRLLQEATPGAVDGVEADLRQFRSPRSLRDVEANVRVAVLSPSGLELT
jgi:hypothetical protein